MAVDRHASPVVPPLDVTVVVATYGDEEWRDLARRRAIPSALQQAPVVHAHGDTLAKARNAGVRDIDSEHVVFLDADDELAPGYMAAMAEGFADLRAPSVEYIRGSNRQRPIMPRVAAHRHECSAECLPEGNWMVIGTLAPTDLVLDVGGFREFEWSEDWDLWLRCWLAGASIEAIPGATYQAHVRHDSRNRAPTRDFRNQVHWQIHRANFPEEYA